MRVEGDGHEGWGEAVAEANPYYSSETTETAWHIITEFLSPRVLGRVFEHPRDVFEAHARGPRPSTWPRPPSKWPRWDLYARSVAQPLSRVLGGTRTRIASGVSIGIQDSLDQLRDKIERELAAGYQRIKIKIKPGWDITAVDMVRGAFGMIPLMVDANAAYTLGDADHLARLDAHQLMMIEQPLDYDDVSDHAALQARIATPICLDESIHTCGSRATPLPPAPAASSTSSRGGSAATASRSVCTISVREHGIPVWHGGMLETGIGRAHNIHLASLPNFSLPGDIAASKRYYEPDLIDPPIEVAPDGTIAVPDAPGIGVQIVADRVERATLRAVSLDHSNLATA